MRKFSLFVLAFALLLSANVTANEVDPCSEDLRFLEPGPSSIAVQIENLLEEYDGFNLGEADEMSAVVHFVVNSDQELVVVEVETPEARLEQFVKNRLNYEKVEDQTLETGKIYTLPIRVRA